MFEMLERRAAVPGIERNRQRREHPGKGRVYSRFQDAYPEEYADQNIGCRAHHAQPVHGEEQYGSGTGEHERSARYFGRVEQRDDDDGADIVDDRDREQQYL